MSMIAAHASWHMEHWGDMSIYLDFVDSPQNPLSHTSTGAFLRAVWCVKANKFDAAKVRRWDGSVDGCVD